MIMLKKVFVFMLLSVFSASSGMALSDAEYREMREKSKYFREADDELSRTWKEVNKNIPSSDKKWLLEDQRNWLKTERDEEARELMERGLTRNCAYARVAKRRTGNLRVYEYNANLSQEDKDAGRVRADDYYYNEDEDQIPPECLRKK